MKRRISFILMIIIVLSSSLSYGVIGIEDQLRSYILADYESGQVLEEYNIDEVIEIASISKIMTYLVVMDEVTKGNASLKDTIMIDKDTARIGGSSLKLEIGEVFTVEELIDGAMVISANDAAYALSKYIGGTEANFATMMNEKSRQIGLENAKFYNSTGLPLAGGVQNVMTTRELFTLAQHIIKTYPQVLEVTQKFAVEVRSRDFFQRNTNPLLMEVKEVDGLKTGFTNKAGYCNLSTFNMLGQENTSKDLRLISIIMGADGFKERKELSRVLVDYGMKNYSNKIILNENIALEKIQIPKADIVETELFPRESLNKLVKSDQLIDVLVEIDENLSLPIVGGQTIGQAIVKENGEEIFQTDIILNQDIKKANWFQLMIRYISNLYDKLTGSVGRAPLDLLIFKGIFIN